LGKVREGKTGSRYSARCFRRTGLIRKKRKKGEEDSTHHALLRDAEEVRSKAAFEIVGSKGGGV
jgi:hypothetical protein